MTNRDAIDDIVLVTEAVEAVLNQRQLMDYRNHREKLIRWMLTLGKDPDRADGYAWDTARQRAYRLDKFYRWVWDREGGYTLSITTDHADAYSKHLAYQDHSTSHKATIQKALKTLFKFQRFEQGTDVEWDPVVTFTDTGGTHQPRDFLTRAERRLLKEAALEYGSIPNYNSLTPAERDRWKVHLAQRFEKPKAEISKQDWTRANGWKYPSIVWVSMDAGLRPKEVGRARLTWLDLENAMLRIPKGDSTKNEGNWNVSQYGGRGRRGRHGKRRVQRGSPDGPVPRHDDDLGREHRRGTIPTPRLHHRRLRVSRSRSRGDRDRTLRW